MTKKIRPKRTAFTILELSMSIIVIGFLVVAVIAGTKLLDNARVGAAQLMTASSPVKDTKGLVMWLDAVSEGSFDAAQMTSSTGKIRTWYDITKKYNATQSISANQPVYRQKAINGLPGVFFSSTSGVGMIIDNTLTTDNYTIFVVFNSTITGGSRRAIQSQTVNWHIGPYGGYVAHYSGTGFVSQIATQVASKAYVADAVRSASASKFYVNGTDVTINGALNTPPNTLALGASGLNNEPLNGSIGEVIIFDRDLSTDERQDIENYLIKKWKI